MKKTIVELLVAWKALQLLQGKAPGVPASRVLAEHLLCEAMSLQCGNRAERIRLAQTLPSRSAADTSLARWVRA